MIIFTLFALFSAVFVLWRRARKVIAVAALALFWLLSAGWLTAPVLALVQHDASHYPPPTFGPRTIIVVLGAGTEYDRHGALVPKSDALSRLATTASLYAQCKQGNRHCEIIISGGNPQRHPATEAQTYAPYLTEAHVARDDLVLEKASLTTYENAEFVARILHSERYDSLMLVTSAYHMPRALLDFHRFGLTPEPVASSGKIVRCGLLPRLPNLIAANVALHELIGMAQFYVYRALGWF
ncbi:YdcF family protein [Trinickia dinghuensis]|uniref:YdcF family protein n=1 Tax=Trinickia dinghuensis TaxID=2291023 RepID=UPI003CCC693E